MSSFLLSFALFVLVAVDCVQPMSLDTYSEGG
jgi:hypothetical protein